MSIPASLAPRIRTGGKPSLLLAYPENPAKDAAGLDRRLRAHEDRDGTASSFLVPALGLYCRDLYINNPFPAQSSVDEQARAIRERLAAISVICIATRPPLNDVEGRRTIRTSKGLLETVIHQAVREVIPYCDRKTVELDEEVIHGDSDVMKAHFQCTDETFAVPRRPTERRSGGKPRAWTAGYFLRLEQLWPQGPALVCAFGLSGPMTLFWCYLLANHEECAHRLRKASASHLLVARVYLNRAIETDPHFLSFVDEWKVEFAVDQPLPKFALPPIVAEDGSPVALGGTDA